MEVCQYFGYYLPGSVITSQMTLSQRTVNMLYALRDYSPLMTSLALMLLPIALLPTRPDQLAVIVSEHRSNLLSLKLSFVTMFLFHKINSLIMYNHIGLSKVTNFQSQEVWIAPCKPFFSIHLFDVPSFRQFPFHSVSRVRRYDLTVQYP